MHGMPGIVVGNAPAGKIPVVSSSVAIGRRGTVFDHQGVIGCKFGAPDLPAPIKIINHIV